MSTSLPDAVARAIWDVVDAAIVVSSAAGIRYVTPGFARLARVPADSLLGIDLTTLVEPVQRQAFAAHLRALLRDVAAEPCAELTLVIPNVRVLPTEHAAHVVVVGGERLVVSSFVPVADRDRMVDALAASERRYRALFEEDTDGRFVVTADWRFIDCNAVLGRVLGFADGAAVVGRSLLEMTPDGPSLQKLLAVARVEGRAGPAELQVERADGTLIDVACAIAASPGENGTVVSLRGKVIEITERKRLETRLQGAERMEAVGRLAGGLAHDFNNLLTVISGNSERLLDALPPHDPLTGAVAAIDQAASRAAAMTRQLLAYGRRQVFALEPVSLERLVAAARPLLTEIVGDHITVRVDVAESMPLISADPRQIEHVIANLALNAREAMPSGGTLTITVDEMEIGENAPRDRAWLRPGRYVRLVVADSGHGMDPVTKAYAFQPFFTTKRMGNGRGLGLATVYGIVKQSHGFVWVESDLGRGATFTLLFPALRSDESQPDAGPISARGETILIVEADSAARGFVGDTLRRRGYQVLAAASPAEALEIFASHPSRVHLVLSDRSLVTAQGTPLVARLKAIDPLVQSLVMLEPTRDERDAPRVLPTTPVIQKPFTLHALADKVREVLDSGEGRA
jgi:two-component system, cell cycle sensor histidine kinase and response regulator CckA